MNFDSFVTNPVEAYSPVLVVGFLIAAYAVAYIFLSGLYLKRGGLWLAVVAVTGIVGLGIVALHMQGISDEVKEKNQNVAEENLKKKYDLVDVLWENQNTYPESYDMTKIVVQDKENNILNFGYKISHDTLEPYLLNEDENSSVKSNDLLVDKSDK